MVELQAILVLCIAVGFAVCGGAALGLGAAIIAIRQRWGKWS